jgi:hypothetical protein
MLELSLNQLLQTMTMMVIYLAQTDKTIKSQLRNVSLYRIQNTKASTCVCTHARIEEKTKN